MEKGMGQRRTFGMTELCEMSGAKPTQVEHWCRLNIIIPVQDAPGRGTYRIFSLANVIEAHQASIFAGHGLSGKQLQQLFAVQRQRAADAGFTGSAFVALQYLVLAVKGIAMATHQTERPEYVIWMRDGEALIKSIAGSRRAVGLQLVLPRNKAEDPDDRIHHLVIASQASRNASISPRPPV